MCTTLRGELHLLTLDTLWIRDMKPSIMSSFDERTAKLLRIYYTYNQRIVVFFVLFVVGVLASTVGSLGAVWEVLMHTQLDLSVLSVMTETTTHSWQTRR